MVKSKHGENEHGSEARAYSELLAESSTDFDSAFS